MTQERQLGGCQSPLIRVHLVFNPHLSHLMGFFYRTIRMVENGIKPAYVFDGKPPDLKAGVVSVPPIFF